MKEDLEVLRHAHIFLILDILCSRYMINADQIKLKGTGLLSFPTSDVLDVVVDKNECPIVSLNVLCLTSIDTCLPLYFYEILRSEEGEKLKDIIDVMVQILFIQLYQYLQLPHSIAAGSQENKNYLMGLSAMLPRQDKWEPFKIFFSRTQTKRQLCSLLQTLCQCSHIAIDECVPSWQPLVNSSSCLKFNVLSDNAVLGDRFLNASSFLVVHIVISRDVQKAINFLPYNNLGRNLQSILGVFVGYCLRYKTIVNLVNQPKEKLMIGEKKIILGQYSVIGSLMNVSNEYVFQVS